MAKKSLFPTLYKVINIYRLRQNDVLHYDVKDISTGRLRTVFRHMMGPESPEVQVKIEKKPDYSPEFAPLNTATLNTSWDDEELDTFLSFIDSKYEPTENVVSVPIKKTRFASVTESTIAEASASVNEKTTMSSTKWGVKVLKGRYLVVPLVVYTSYGGSKRGYLHTQKSIKI